MNQAEELQIRLESQAYRAMIEHLKLCGFYQDEDHIIRCDGDVKMTFETWQQAVFACIEVATGA